LTNFADAFLPALQNALSLYGNQWQTQADEERQLKLKERLAEIERRTEATSPQAEYYRHQMGLSETERMDTAAAAEAAAKQQGDLNVGAAGYLSGSKWPGAAGQLVTAQVGGFDPKGWGTALAEEAAWKAMQQPKQGTEKDQAAIAEKKQTAERNALKDFESSMNNGFKQYLEAYKTEYPNPESAPPPLSLEVWWDKNSDIPYADFLKTKSKMLRSIIPETMFPSQGGLGTPPPTGDYRQGMDYKGVLYDVEKAIPGATGALSRGLGMTQPPTGLGAPPPQTAPAGRAATPPIGLGAGIKNYATMSIAELEQLLRQGDREAGAELGRRMGF